MDPININEIRDNISRFDHIREAVLHQGKRFVILKKDENKNFVVVLSKKELSEKLKEGYEKVDDISQAVLKNTNLKELIDLRTSYSDTRKKFSFFKETKAKKIDELRAKCGLGNLEDPDHHLDEQSYNSLKERLERGELFVFDLKFMSPKTKQFEKEKSPHIDKDIHYLLRRYSLSTSQKLEIAALLCQHSQHYPQATLKRALSYLVPKNSADFESVEDAQNLVALSKSSAAPFKRDLLFNKNLSLLIK